MKIKLGTMISNRYKIIEQIGSGGMAVVYKARDIKLGRVVAFKVLRNEYIKDEEFIKRFDVEARAAASLSHPNIVSIYDVGHDGKIYYIVMEFVDGITLKDVIKDRAPFSNEEIIGISIQIASALSCAHKKNIVHRDVKPQNILITTDGGVKITDFGIAKGVSNKTIFVGSKVMASVHYASPEQIKGSYITFKNDIYSLGIVMFEMATNKVPFEGDTAISIAIKQINDSLPDIRSINHDISEGLEKIILHATQKFASKRYNSMQDMENDLWSLLRKKNNYSDINNSNELDSSDNNNSELSEIQDIDINNFSTIKINREDIEKIKKETQVYGEYDLHNDSESNNKYKISERRVVISAIITSCVFIFIISFFGYKKFFNAKTIEAPELIGMSLEEANEIAQTLGIKIKEVGEEYNSIVDKDKISSQNYNPGDDLRKGDTIGIKLSLGIEQVVMPYVINKDLTEAYNFFKNYLFDVDEIYEYSSSVPNNIVMRQKPDAGETVDENANVTLYISRGKEIKNIRVPNIVGLSESDAKIKLQTSDLIIGTITKSNSDKYPNGVVIAQTVSPGKEVQTGTIINFIVSTGPEPTKTTPTPIPNITPSHRIIVSPNITIPSSIASPSHSSIVTEDIVKSKTLIIDPAINFDDRADVVRIKILRIKDNVTEVFFDQNVSVSELPLQFNIEKSGAGEYQTYLIDEAGNSSYQGSSFINF